MQFINSNTNKRYYTLDYYFKKKYGFKVFKVSLNAGFSCPNIDGKITTGGCIYCSKQGSGDFAGDISKNLETQFSEVKNKLKKKWPKAKYIAYFQAHTNTYAPLNILKEKYESVLKIQNVIGISIATRPDSISDEVLDYLEELNKRTYVIVELGLQSIHENTSLLINRGHNLEVFTNMVQKLKERNIEVVVHIINSLPFETKEMMLDTVKYLNKLNIDGIKIHMLHVLKDTKLATMYQEKKFELLTREEYISIVCDQIELLNPNIVIHRISSDANVDDLIAPLWINKKFNVMNDIDKELVRRKTFQGFQKTIYNKFHQLIEERIKDKDIVIDSTIGNGNDSLYLLKLVKNGYLFGFDIQNKAIINTDNLLKENNIHNYKLFLTGHENVYKYLKEYEKKISLVIYNLGYLPNGNKEITTKTSTTIKSIKESIKLLNNKGFILIVVYPHEEGKKEAMAIKNLKIDGYITLEYHNTDNIESPYLIEINRKNVSNN